MIARDLLDLWPKSSGNKCKSVVMKEYQILQLLDYKVWLKGCIPLRIVHYCLQHYSISLMLRTHELVLLENISIAIVEQIHQFKDILCWDNLELALSVVLASVALAGQNNFRLSSDNKQWRTFSHSE